MENNRLKITSLYKGMASKFCLAIALFLGGMAFSQSTPSVASEIDVNSIKIGEQVTYTIKVEADSTAQIVFPEGQTFSPLEMVEAIMSDTVRKLDRMTLQKIYALTQFDSGAYTIPRQQVVIDGKNYFTDSVTIAVANVPVDTLAQKMYDIKPLLEVEKSNIDLWKNALWILLGLLILGGLVYWFLIRKKPLTEEEKVALLPPFDRALLELKRLENSKYIIQDEYKQYYSELTDIVRSYLEEDVHVSALESTTDQLIEKLELMKDAGELKLDDETIDQFKKVLQTADLVKFAKSKPETSVAEQDRKVIEQIVIKTKEALPEPDEEDLMQDEEYLEEISRKKQRKKWTMAAAVTVGIIFLSTLLAIAYYGWTPVKDTVMGHPTKELLEGDWLNSTYGYPPISLETPNVLIRQDLKLPPEVKATVKEAQAFAFSDPDAMFSIGVSSTTFSSQDTEPDFQNSVEQVLKSFEAKGAKNITTKQEEFRTISGTLGVKVYGSGKFTLPQSSKEVNGQYAIIIFGGKGFQQQIILNWLEDDPYAEKIVDRITHSIEVKTGA
ncbi:BatD family protein [Sediminicola sp. 1XM1-17]|uniref:BatD family protein n=1 Tax=Sediminicola sp. 1XM1-17 TaxID=3127702 RepID=UPI00307747F8